MIKCLKMLFPGCDIQIVPGRKETDEDLEIQKMEKADIDNEEDKYLDS